MAYQRYFYKLTEAEDLPGANVTIAKMAMDANGNKTLYLKTFPGKAISIQTNSNLPYTHKQFDRHNYDHIPEDKKAVEEIVKYLKQFYKKNVKFYESECDCSTCPKAESCQKKKEREMQETCPENSTPRGGKCARADNNGYLKGTCDKGYTFDRGKDECVKIAKESTERFFEGANAIITTEGSKIYVEGNTYAIKDQLKAAGCKWDPNRKAWYASKAKLPEVEKIINGDTSAIDRKPVRETPYDGEVQGKVTYKGKSYYVRWAGRTSAGKDAVRLVTFDGTLDFWTDASNVRWEKEYEKIGNYGKRSSNGRYPTLQGIRDFVKRKKSSSSDDYGDTPGIRDAYRHGWDGKIGSPSYYSSGAFDELDM